MMERGNLTLLWVLTRAWAALCGLQLFPYPHSENLFSDVRLYDWWAGNITAGHFPINDPMWQYPPLAAVVFTVGYVIAHNTVGFVILALACDAVVQSLLLTHGGRRRTLFPAQIWLAMPVLVGPIALGRFDVFPTAAAILALLTVGAASGGWLAIGALLKVWPGLGLLALPRATWRRTLPSFVLSTAALIVLLHAWWPGGMSFLGEQEARGLQVESVGALPYALWSAGPGTVRTDFRYGALEYIAQGTGWISLAMTLVLVSLLAALGKWRLQGRLERIAPADVMMTVVISAMVTSRVLSPQYNVWLIGLLAVCAFEPMPHFLRVVRLIAISALCAQALYPWQYGNYLLGGVVPAIIQTVRIVALVWAAATCWQGIVSRREPANPIRQATP